ncbi:MAG TPA: bifunctional cytidylyltransferase/SDR family oxidoreductase, partial [Methanomassiliicoccales archaeon]|nr:bifunctional cytidylyltransferase/SDR family oxidoreductase [Methanomassiliicoccales archaeon]
TFEANRSIDHVVVVVNRRYLEQTRSLVKEYGLRKVRSVVPGGATRQASSFEGLKACPEGTTHVLIHDAVRPFVDDDIIDRCVSAFREHQAVDVCLASTDTIVEIDGNQDISGIPLRSTLRRGQTPQGFQHSLILKAHQLALQEGFTDSTDDCNLLVRSRLAPVHTIEGSAYNIKITNPLDIFLAERIFQLRRRNLSPLSREGLSSYLQGKVLAVFGGSSGIGKSICGLAEECGATAISLSRSSGADITDAGQVKAALDKVARDHGRIDAVVLCSAVMHRGKLVDAEDSQVLNQVQVNLAGNILVSKYAIPHLVKTKGKLVFFASSSYTKGREGYAVYSATKAAIVNLMQALADELSGQVDVIAINPQRTRTPLRVSNFGEEDAGTLLSPEFVALRTLGAMASGLTGSVFDISLTDEIGRGK